MDDQALAPFDRHYQLIRWGRRRVLLATLDSSLSFGVLLISVIRGLQLARQHHASLYMLLSKPAVNSAVLCLETGDVSMVAPVWWRTAGAWAAWYGSAVMAARPRGFRALPGWLRETSRGAYGLALKRLAKSRRLPKPMKGRMKQRLATFEERHVPPAQLAKFRKGGHTKAHPVTVFDFRLDYQQIWSAPSPAARFPLRLEQRAQREAATLGLSPTTAIVTLHVREAGFRPSLGLKERASDLARDAAVDSYRPAIDWLVAQDYTVVRIGDPTMTRFAHPGVIDLATHGARTDLLEIWCIMHSRFYIGCDSGAMHAPVLTNTPRLLVNVKDPILAYPSQPHDLCILKPMHDAESGRRLTLREILTTEFFGRKNDFDRVDYRDNSPDEIADAVGEMVDALRTTPPPSPSQLECRRLVDAVIWDTIRANRAAGIDCDPWQPGGNYVGCGWIARRFADRYLDALTESTTHAAGRP